MLCVHHPPTSSSHPQHVQHKRVRQSLENRWASIEEEKKSLLLSPETPVREAFHFMCMHSFIVHCLFFFHSRVVDELVLHLLWGLWASAGHRIYIYIYVCVCIYFLCMECHVVCITISEASSDSKGNKMSYGACLVINDDPEKYETKLTASILRQDPDQEKVKRRPILMGHHKTFGGKPLFPN